MAKEKIKIGDQNYVWSQNNNAWIEESTGKLANQGIQSLLELASKSTLYTDELSLMDPSRFQKEETARQRAEPVSEKEKDEGPQEALVVNIGGQKFVVHPKKGWIDEKTKIPATKDIVKLLEKITGIKAENKLITSQEMAYEPITIGKQKYTFDTKNGLWIDSKTKTKADDAVQKLLDATAKAAGMGKVTAAAPSLGIVEGATKDKVKKKEPPKKKSDASPERVGESLSPLFGKMANHLAQIDYFLKVDLANSITKFKNENSQAREDAIEERNNEENTDAIPENGGKPKSGGNGLSILGVVALVTLAFEPVRNSLEQTFETLSSAISGTTKIAKSMNKFFDFALGNAKKNEGEDTNFEDGSTSTITQKNDNGTIQNGPDGSPYNPGWENNVKLDPPKSATQIPMKPSIVNPNSTPIDPSVFNRPNATPIPRDEKSNTAARDDDPGRYIHFTANTGRREAYNNMNASAKKAFFNAAKEYWQTTGKKLQLNSGHRTRAEQKGITSPYMKAKGRSKHQDGLAVDIQQKGNVRDLMAKHGFKWFGSKDPVHYTYQGAGSSISPSSTPQAGINYTPQNNNVEYMSDMGDKSAGEILTDSVKSMFQMIRKMGSVDSIYLGTPEEMAINKTNKIGEIALRKYRKSIDDLRETEDDGIKELPNLNKLTGNVQEQPVRTPATQNDKLVVNQYLHYFNY